MLWLDDAGDDAEYPLNSSVCCQQRTSLSLSLSFTGNGHCNWSYRHRSFMEIANKTMRLTWLAWLKTKCNYTLIICGFFYVYRDMRLLRSAIFYFSGLRFICTESKGFGFCGIEMEHTCHGMSIEYLTSAIALKRHQSNQWDPWDQIPSYCRIWMLYSVVIYSYVLSTVRYQFKHRQSCAVWHLRAFNPFKCSQIANGHLHGSQLILFRRANWMIYANYQFSITEGIYDPRYASLISFVHVFFSPVNF